MTCGGALNDMAVRPRLTANDEGRPWPNRWVARSSVEEGWSGMSGNRVEMEEQQTDLFEAEAARSLLDELLTDSRLYTKSKDYKELLDFVVRLRNFAPFNAMLLQVQKPGLSYAASARDWRERFGRMPKKDARPLLILWPFGPVALVYDVLDTEGDPLPNDVASFFAHGSIDERRLASFVLRTDRKNIKWDWVDAGDRRAGSILVIKRATKEKETTFYCMHINRNHAPAVQFATLAHELGHLFLGHLGSDKALNVPQRPSMEHDQRELEAESVAYLVCARNGVTSKSETYLTNYVTENTTVDDIDLFQVLRAAGQVENLLGLTAHTKFDRPTPGRAGSGSLFPLAHSKTVEAIKAMSSGETYPPAPRNPKLRVVGQTYRMPSGTIGTWIGLGYKLVEPGANRWRGR